MAHDPPKFSHLNTFVIMLLGFWGFSAGEALPIRFIWVMGKTKQPDENDVYTGLYSFSVGYLMEYGVPRFPSRFASLSSHRLQGRFVERFRSKLFGEADNIEKGDW